MSKSSDVDLDLELHFLPAWAQKPPQENKYEHFAGETGPSKDRDRDRRPRQPGRRPSGQPGSRPAQGQSGGGGRPSFGRGPQQQRPPRGDDRRRPMHEQRSAPPQPLPELTAAFIPDDKGVDSLARQIKMTGRAYPLFEIAQMVLQKPEQIGRASCRERV